MEILAGGTQHLRGCLKHTQIHNIEGKILGKDGKPLMPIRTKAVRGASLTQEETIVEPLIGNEPDLDNSFWNSAPVIDKEATTDATSEKTDSQCMGSKSYVNVVAAAKPNPKLNFRTLFNKDKVEHSDFVLPVENVMAAQNKFANSLVGFFVGKRVAFPLVLEQGPWLIRNQPLILTKWAPNLDLAKDVVKKVPVWVKVHRVPVEVYSDDGVSLIASQIGKHVMLDAFTSSMCSEPWGRMGYARALIEISAENELKNEIRMVVPIVEGEGHTIERTRVEYEWKPPRCPDCLVFGHDQTSCPKRVVVPKPVKPKGNDPKSSTSGYNANEKAKVHEGENNGVKLRNLFEKLNDITHVVDPNSEAGETSGKKGGVESDEAAKSSFYEVDSDDEVDEHITMEKQKVPSTKGASTPSDHMALPVQNINHSAFRSMFEREKLSGFTSAPEKKGSKLALCSSSGSFKLEYFLLPIITLWEYDTGCESATRILNMVPTKKVDKTPYELWYGKVPNLSYLKVWGCEALVKRDTPDKLEQRSSRNQWGWAVMIEEIQEEEDTTPSEITSNIPQEVEGFEPPQEEVIPIRRITKDMFIGYGGNPSTELRVECYCDARFETDRDDTKSQTRLFSFLNGGRSGLEEEGTHHSPISTTEMSASELIIAQSEADMEAV
ncbi:hypothetical protein Tco_1300538 [Tanacetum coccineum]